jgi:hypothetical protein
MQLYDEAQKLLTETAMPIVPLFWRAETTVLNPHFTGLEFNSMARLDLRRVRPAAKAPNSQ